jgi:hypothetical protein
MDDLPALVDSLPERPTVSTKKTLLKREYSLVPPLKRRFNQNGMMRAV